eukprot:GHVU01215208.1.p1 GENE.GHVU01215208.1~~GHVU01215208.1.p1  ORF type:complete len:1351 (+),score=297.54 GHVU01215208.1:139-4191(+)
MVNMFKRPNMFRLLYFSSLSAICRPVEAFHLPIPTSWLPAVGSVNRGFSGKAFPAREYVSECPGGFPCCHQKFNLNSSKHRSSGNRALHSGAAATLPPLNHRDFRSESAVHIPERDIDVYRLTHIKSRARVMYIAGTNDNPERVFTAAFSTPPKDDKGVPHVLEHSVLCGSKAFPVRDPMQEMKKRSLQTFLNAMTFADRTLYPIASANIKDFYNLAHVYADATLSPNVMEDERILRQEGWRLTRHATEPEEEVVEKGEKGGQTTKEESRGGGGGGGRSDDSSSSIAAAGLAYSGVVFNEMKGAYANKDRVLTRLLDKALFTNSTYRYDSGGSPEEIPSLTYSELKQFHRANYSPINSRFYYYQPRRDDPQESLQFISKMLNGFGESEGHRVEIEAEPPRDGWVREEGRVAAAGDKKDSVAIGWVLPKEFANQYDRIKLSMVSGLLAGTTVAPLYLALMDSKLGESAGAQASTSFANPSFTVDLRGVTPGDGVAKEVEDIVMKCLNDIYEKGFDLKAVKSILSRLEFGLRECNPGGLPRGLHLIQLAEVQWNYGKDPEEALQFEATLQRVQSELKQNKRLFEDAMKTYLLDNNHRATVHLRADDEKEKEDREGERQRVAATARSILESKEKTLAAAASASSGKKTPPDAAVKAAAVDEMKKDIDGITEFLNGQDDEETLNKLPKLEIKDVDRNEEVLPRRYLVAPASRAPVVLSEFESTNGIVYVTAALDLHRLSLREHLLLPLLTGLLGTTGTAEKSEEDQTFDKLQHTGGLYWTTAMGVPGAGRPVVSHPQFIRSFALYTGEALEGKVEKLFELMVEDARKSKLDNKKRTQDELREAVLATEHSLSADGLSLALATLRARATVGNRMHYLEAGIPGFRMTQELKRRAHDDVEFVKMSEELTALRQKLLSRENLVIGITATGAAFERLWESGAIDRFAQQLCAPFKERDELKEGREAIVDDGLSNHRTSEHHDATEVVRSLEAAEEKEEELPGLYPEQLRQRITAAIRKEGEGQRRGTEGDVLKQIGETKGGNAATRWASSIVEEEHADGGQSQPVPVWAKEVWDKYTALRKREGGEGDADVVAGAAVPTLKVNYVTMAKQMFDPLESVPGSSLVADTALRDGYLYEKVRVMGGAYGASMRIDEASGNALLMSIADPHVSTTFEAYERVGTVLRQSATTGGGGGEGGGAGEAGEGRMSDEELECAKISTVAGMDRSRVAHVSAKGMSLFRRVLFGVTDASRQKDRNDVLKTSFKDLETLGARYEKRLATRGGTTRVVVGPPPVIEALESDVKAAGGKQLTEAQTQEETHMQKETQMQKEAKSAPLSKFVPIRVFPAHPGGPEIIDELEW